MPLLNPQPIDFSKSWNTLEIAVTIILTEKDVRINPDDWMALYTEIYRVCTNISNPYAETLYYKLRNLLKVHIAAIYDALKKEFDNYSLLRKYAECFERYSIGLEYITKLFVYLNRYWIKAAHCETGQIPTAGVYVIDEMGMHLWKEIVFTPMQENIVAAVIDIVNDIRFEPHLFLQYQSLLKEIVKSFMVLNLNKQDYLELYRKELELPIIKSTTAFYTVKSAYWKAQLSISEYLAIVEKVCAEEEYKCNQIFHHMTATRVRMLCCKVLIENNVDYLCGDVETFLCNACIDDLRRLFNFFSQASSDKALMALKKIFKDFIEARGMSFLNGYNEELILRHPDAYIQGIMGIWESHYCLVKDAFQSHPIMRSSLDTACRMLANHYPSMSEFLARYSDAILSIDGIVDFAPRNAQVSITTEQINEELLRRQRRSHVPRFSHEERTRYFGCIAIIFGLLQDKDCFQHVYWRLLANRILYNTSYSKDFEYQMLDHIRKTCGNDYVSKFVRMFNDKLLSNELTRKVSVWLNQMNRETMQELYQRIQTETGIRIDHRIETILQSFHLTFYINVLSAGSWPYETLTEEERFNTTTTTNRESDRTLALVNEIAVCKTCVSWYYSNNTHGRKLQWLDHLSTCTLRMRIENGPKKEYDIQTSYAQMLVLLLYNEKDAYSLSEMEERIGMKRNELEEHLEYLKHAKLLRITEFTNASTTQPEFLLTFNKLFYSRRRKLFVYPRRRVDGPKESPTIAHRIMDDRKMILQAAIVRLMKFKKRLHHTMLVAEVTKQLENQFVPTISDIKETIEILFSREYMRRVEGQLDEYEYIL